MEWIKTLISKKNANEWNKASLTSPTHVGKWQVPSTVIKTTFLSPFITHLLSICQICQRTAVQIFSSHHRHHQTSNCRYLIFSLLVPKMCHLRGEVELKMDHTLLCQDQMDLKQPGRIINQHQWCRCKITLKLLFSEWSLPKTGKAKITYL